MTSAAPALHQTALLGDAHRIVVKIGSALLVEEESGDIRYKWLDSLAADLADLAGQGQGQGQGQELIIVSSGAIAVGRRQLGLPSRRLKLEEKQAAAAAGQIRLAHAYQEALARHDIIVAQVLLTLEDTEARRRHLNARNTLNTLLKHRALPVINENDTVATSEIRVGDNDRLAARVAAMMNADALILLSDIDGLYTGDPKLDPSAAHLSIVEKLTPEIEAMAGDALPGVSTGGMVTKLAAARIAVAAGCRMAIANGTRMHPLRAILQGERCTWFLSDVEPRAARKSWIAGSLRPAGTLVLDEGALRALKSGRSLLPAGVRSVEGDFQRGDAVLLRDLGGQEVARGLSAYNAEDARRIIGHNSRDIEKILGYRGREELIHRDDLVLS